MGLFDNERVTKKDTLNLAKKIKRTTSNNSGSSSLKGMENIKLKVESLLSKYANTCEIYYADMDLQKYIDKCIENKIVAVDTETEGLNPISDKIAGLCLDTHGENSIYIPINHKSAITGKLVNNQFTCEQLKPYLQQLIDNDVKIIFHNAIFDIRVIINSIGIELPCHWDTFVAAVLLDENEEHGLKKLYIKYINPQEPYYEFKSLYPNTIITTVPIKYVYVYAARDARLTLELYEYQYKLLTEDKSLHKLYKLLTEIEIPVISVIVAMEQEGVRINIETAKKLEDKYNNLLDTALQQLNNEVETYKKEILAAQKKGIVMDYPLNWSSPLQVSTLFYDIIKIGIIDPKEPKGTGKKILEKIEHPIAKLLLQYRGAEKLLTTYLVKLPKMINPLTNRLHCNFNQCGTDTGRLSSSDPNLQNIPSRAKDIRTMFEAENGNVLISSDFSSQEPRIATHLCKDKAMIQAFEEGKDLYSVIASVAFNVPYEECKEFRADGSKNPEGKERRSIIKAIFLGVLYSKQVPSIAKDLNITKIKAQKIYDKVMQLFPSLPPLINDSLDHARKYGYVETVWGRRRRLPHMQIPKYHFSLTSTSSYFNPLDFSGEATIPISIKSKYTKLMDSMNYQKDKLGVIKQAEKEGIKINDNTFKVIESERKCLNSRVQGSAADQSKIAMVLVHNNKELKKLGFKLLLSIHDELIGEVPKENYKKAGELFSKLMNEAGKELIVPSKCDIEVVEQWNGKAYIEEE